MTLRNFLISCAVVSILSGCAGLPVDNEMYVPLSTVELEPVEEIQGVYHKVKPGETLWRIAKAYNIDINEIVETNNIPDAAQIEKNQLILIPGAEHVMEIILDLQETDDNFIWPVKGRVIQYFGQPSSDGGFNKGIAIKVPEGEPVKSSRSGTVVFADYLNGYGYTVILAHSDGFHTVYANNSKILVSVGDQVKKNSPIAYVGRLNHLAFLHFEVRKNSREDNPLHYLP